MSFYEIEIWRPEHGAEAEHDALIRRWFAYLHQKHHELFPEWTSARYFREVERNEDVATGRKVMMFGYRDHGGFAAYKERRKNWDGPYAEYKQLDPYPLFAAGSVITEHWQPHEQALWQTWAPTTPESFFDVVCWTPLPGKQTEHDGTMRLWFAFVTAHHDRLFAEWLSAHYFRAVQRETGALLDRYMMIFEYNHRAGFLERKCPFDHGNQPFLTNEFRRFHQFCPRPHIGTFDRQLAGEHGAQIQRHISTGGCTTGDQASAFRKGFDTGIPYLRSDMFDHDIDPSPFRQQFYLLRDVLLRMIDHGISP